LLFKAAQEVIFAHVPGRVPMPSWLKVRLIKRASRRQLRHYDPSRLVNILVVWSLLLASTVAAQVQETRRVLSISEGGLSYPASVLVNQEIHAALNADSSYHVEFYTENLDTSLFPSESYPHLGASYLQKYRERRPDAIVTVGPSPLKLFLSLRKSFFPDVPIVFCGSSPEQADSPKLDARFTGVWLVPEPAKTLDVALQLQPSTQHVVVVGGVGEYDRGVEAIVKENLKDYERKLDITYLTNLPMPELLYELKHLSENTIVLFTSMTQDAAGTRFINGLQSLPMVSGASKAPVFGLADTLLGHGTVGGYVVSFAAQGNLAAGMLSRILKGEKPEDIPIVVSPSRYMFDWRELRRWGFKESLLPAGSTVLYREPTFWEAYKWQSISTLIVGLALVVLSAYLLIERRRRSGSERSLESNLEFERLISELSTEFIDLPVKNYHGGIEDGLGRIARFLKIDRVSLLEFADDDTELVVTHVSTEADVQTPALRLEKADLPWFMPRILNNETVVVSSLNQLPAAAQHERNLMMNRGIRSVVAVPLLAGGRVLGVLSCIGQEERQWSDRLVDQLKMTGQVFANAIVRKRVDEILRVNQSQLKDVIDSAMDAIVVLDAHQHIVLFNAAAEKMYGCTAKEALGHPIDRFIPRRFRDRHREHIQRFGESHVTGRTMANLGTVWGLRTNGEEFPIEATISATEAGGKTLFTAILRDITEQRKTQQDQMELTGRLIGAHEEERSRLARELHDDFNQRLAVLAIDLERAAERMADSPIEAGQQLHELWNRASEIGADLHAMSHRLHSSTLESLGLVLGVSSFCQEFAEQQKIQVDFAHEDVPRVVPPDVALCLFRIVQEGLRNVKKHSDAHQAEVRLEGGIDGLHLSLSDRGKGFELTQSSVRLGLGIRSIEERVRLVAGRFEIHAQPREGTKIDVWVPLKRVQERAG
jgi:PAS domain S-box-containing protein